MICIFCSSKPSQTVGDQGENIFISGYEGNNSFFGDVGQVGDGLEVHRAVRMGIDHPNDAYIELDRLIASDISLEVGDGEGKTPLHVAAENGLLVIMEQLITGLVERRCQFINAVDGRGSTALHLAVRSGSDDCCVSLLNVKGINVNIKDIEGDAPIHLAVILFASEPTRERGRILHRLLDFNGIDLSLLGAHQSTPLNVMIQNSMWEYVDKILETHQDSLQYADGFGDLPIHTAARCSNEDIVRKLVAMSPETAMVQNTSGETAAQSASHSGNTKVAKYLGDAMLLSAAHSGMEDSVELALRYSSEKSLSCLDAYGDSPAHLAARNGHLSVIQSLIDSSAFDIEDVSCQQNDGGDTPLHLAAAGGHDTIIECLLQSSPDAYRVAVETKNSAGFAPVHLAARYGREEVISKMIQAEYNMSLRPEVTVLTSKDSGGLTALHHAAIKSHEHLVYILLLRGSNANAKDDRGKTPLHWAASGSNQMVMRHLLECGGNPLALDNRQRTPLSIARQYDRSIFNLITECLLFRAVESGSLLGVQEAVEQIQQAGVDVAHVKDFAGLSAAHVAARGGHADILKWLIQGYVPVGEMNDVGEQCIHIACKAGKLQCVRILLNHDLNLVYDTTSDGDTPLHIASREGWVDIVKLILDECYLSTSVVNEKGNTPLHEAVCELQYDAVKALLEAGADPNERQRYGGNTPLHLVALWGSPTNSRAIVTLLLQHGASLSEVNNLGETPEQVAEASGNRLVYPTSLNAPDLIDMDDESDIESEQSFVELDEESDSMSLMTSPVQTQAPDPPLREHSNPVGSGSRKIRAVRAPTNGAIVSPFGQIAQDHITQQRVLNSQGSARGKEPIQAAIEQRPTRSSSDAEHGSLYIQPKHLTIYKNQKLGEGSFGVVFLGMLHGNRVAVKILKQETRQHSARNLSPEKFDQSRQAFIDELLVMSRLRHDNIQSVRGYTELDEGPAIVSAFYDRGSLVTILQKASRNSDAAKQLCWSRRIKLAKDINKGMMCMHNQDVPVIHRDLKAANCFVDERWTAYVGDFGFTRAARDSTSQPYLAAPTNPRWLAPEILQDSTDVEFSPASDVYGFGMLLFELLTFQPPFRSQTIEMCYNLINGGNRPKVPPSLPGDERDNENFRSSGALELYINLMKACWSQRKEDRPDTNEVYSELRAIETIFKKYTCKE